MDTLDTFDTFDTLDTVEILDTVDPVETRDLEQIERELGLIIKITSYMNYRRTTKSGSWIHSRLIDN